MSSKTFDDRLIAEAYATQKTKNMLIEQIISIVQDNPQVLLDEGLSDILKGAWDIGKGAYQGYQGGGALKGAMGTQSGQNLMGKVGGWLNNLGGQQSPQAGAPAAGAPATGAPATGAASASPVPNMGSGGINPAAGGQGVIGQLKALLGQLDIDKLQAILPKIKELAQGLDDKGAGWKAQSPETQAGYTPS